MARQAEQQQADTILAGDILFVAGNALYNRMNQPAKQLPFALAPFAERIDIVGYVNFYGGPPAPALLRLTCGLRNVAVDRVRVETRGNLREIVVRKLHLPQPLENTLQMFWIDACLRGHLRPDYALTILSGPENCWLAERLLATGRASRLIYYDTDHFPSYVQRRWSWIADRQERRLIALADGVVSVSQPLAALRRRQGARQVMVLNNGVPLELFRPAAESLADHPPTLLYTGTLDVRWGVDLALEALPAILAHLPSARLVVAGDGPDETALRCLASQLGIADSVVFTGRLPYEQLPHLMAEADFGVATSRPNAFRQYASPMKIADYLAGGLVILCSGGGEGARLVTESGAGVCIDAQPDQIARTVLSLWEDRQRMRQMREKALAYAKTLSWEHGARRLAVFAAGLVGAGSPSPRFTTLQRQGP
ncbi:MAG: glycosyltransferase family 4 protein [Anaerolineae bacterium]|nr:glycosyltransferase family 4 protein [Anaerolineae bacterium]